MNVVLISTYDLGRQPFGLASPAAWLRASGAAVTCLDLSREPLTPGPLRDADLIAFHVPMHTATRMASQLVEPVRRLNPRAHLCFYGLYASVNGSYLRRLGVQTVIGGEFEQGLIDLAARLRPSGTRAGSEHPEAVVSLARQRFYVPDRNGLVPLERYAHLHMPDGNLRTVGYTEASRGCKHLCRHCPIVPVYHGTFRIVQRDVVLEDIRRQVALGARHITFGDPDFFNGIGHALPLVEALHREQPGITYDVTIKIEHLLQHARHIATLRNTGCLFVTSAVEAVDNAILKHLEKGHTREDFLCVADLFREQDVVLQPTFVPFTPWTTLKGYCDLLEVLEEQGFAEGVAPVQLAIRLLIPAGSRLMELQDVRDLVGPFDEEALIFPWEHADPRVDRLFQNVQRLVHSGEERKLTRTQIFSKVKEAAHGAAGLVSHGVRHPRPFFSRASIPYLTEPWYC